MIRYSKQLLDEIRRCAVQLGPNQTEIRLSGVFKGFKVSLEKSKEFPTDRRSFREDDGIDRDGEYFLIVISL